MKRLLISLMVLVGILSIVSCTQNLKKEKKATGEMDRTVLPIKVPTPPLYTELSVADATPPPPFKVKAPEGAPNVVLVLIDDLGFAGTSKFGGPVPTPTFDRMSSEGVYYNFFAPLLKSKFGSAADQISAAWLCARLKLRSNRKMSGHRPVWKVGSGGIPCHCTNTDANSVIVATSGSKKHPLPRMDRARSAEGFPTG